MYISKIEIDHFGKWENETFTFHPNLQVVQGLNESGKTTIRRFIEQMLFDFKQKKNGVYPYQPLHTNTRGGRMWIEDEGLGSFIIERTAVGSQKKLVLKSAETGQALPESMLERILHELTLSEYFLDLMRRNYNKTSLVMKKKCIVSYIVSVSWDIKGHMKRVKG